MGESWQPQGLNGTLSPIEPKKERKAMLIGSLSVMMFPKCFSTTYHGASIDLWM